MLFRFVVALIKHAIGHTRGRSTIFVCNKYSEIDLSLIEDWENEKMESEKILKDSEYIVRLKELIMKDEEHITKLDCAHGNLLAVSRGRTVGTFWKPNVFSVSSF